MAPGAARSPVNPAPHPARELPRGDPASGGDGEVMSNRIVGLPFDGDYYPGIPGRRDSARNPVLSHPNSQTLAVSTSFWVSVAQKSYRFGRLTNALKQSERTRKPLPHRFLPRPSDPSASALLQGRS